MPSPKPMQTGSNMTSQPPHFPGPRACKYAHNTIHNIRNNSHEHEPTVLHRVDRSSILAAFHTLRPPNEIQLIRHRKPDKTTSITGSTTSVARCPVNYALVVSRSYATPPYCVMLPLARTAFKASPVHRCQPLAESSVGIAKGNLGLQLIHHKNKLFLPFASLPN